MKGSFFLLLVLFPVLLLAEPDCDKAISTPDINRCAAIELDTAEQEMQRYLEVSLEHNAHDAELVASIEQAQDAWQAYAGAHCDSIHTMWREGTIRGVMAISCRTRLTRTRTHELWSAFLTYMHSTEPRLPEPGKQ
ncbi:MAG: DUF1311 domain-containing protein [Ectothiorhodospiraceae bacterium]|nr:DUF1311 domain-containing protein [Ectothiorhodospiraceae bacterium]